MPQYQVTAETPVPSGFAVDQVRGMFDLAAEKVARVSFAVELPADDELIVGKRPDAVGDESRDQGRAPGPTWSP